MASTELAVRRETGLAIHAGHSVLGERAVRIPTCGSVRPGIKVLTKAAAALNGAQDIYDRGVAAGAKWSAIEAEIVKRCNPERSPLTPKNVPYFTVKRADFSMPEIADRIMEMYGEDRGEGVHLYRFPVAFPVDSWQAVLPHSLNAWSRSERKFWSEYDGNGVRVCKMHAPLQVDERSKRAIKPFGGRPSILRPDNGGRCVPESCKEFQSGECKLSGSLIFYIPGISGSGAISLPLTSFYGMNGIRQQLELMLFVRGRIAGLQDGSKPLFYVTKRLEEVSRLNLETKKPEKAKQWIVCVEADIEMTKLMAPEPAALAAPAAIAALEGHTLPPDEAEEEPSAPGMTFEDVRDAVRNRVRQLGLSLRDEYTPYALTKFGAGWSTDFAVLSRVLDELDSVEDEAGYVAQVKGADF